MDWAIQYNLTMLHTRRDDYYKTLIQSVTTVNICLGWVKVSLLWRVILIKVIIYNTIVHNNLTYIQTGLKGLNALNTKLSIAHVMRVPPIRDTILPIKS